MNNTENLWPAIELKGAVSPKSILAEQANILGEMTNNILKANTVRVQTDEANMIKFKFQIIAPTLNNYTFDLFTIEYNVLKLYPINFITSVDRSSEQKNEEEFKNKVSDILKSELTQKIIKALYAQSVEE